MLVAKERKKKKQAAFEETPLAHLLPFFLGVSRSTEPPGGLQADQPASQPAKKKDEKEKKSSLEGKIPLVHWPDTAHTHATQVGLLVPSRASLLLPSPPQRE